ncbi:MAG: hypothetical protein J5680_07210 [Neisseriaceae bacterium]|nr:hypothetical protein [Neisseriaceae bacterium]
MKLLQNPLPKQKFNPAVGWDNTTHHSACGVNLLYFNDFYSALSGGLVGWQAHPTALLAITRFF